MRLLAHGGGDTLSFTSDRFAHSLHILRGILASEWALLRAAEPYFVAQVAAEPFGA